MNLDDLISDEVFTKCSHKISLKACEYHLASREVTDEMPENGEWVRWENRIR